MLKHFGKKRDNVLYNYVGRIYTNVVITFISPFIARVKIIIFCPVFVDRQNVLSYLFFGHFVLVVYISRYATPYTAVYIRIYEYPRGLHIPEYIIGAASHYNTA